MSDVDFIERKRQLETIVADPRSTISIDTLLDALVAIVLDVEGLKKESNFQSFHSKFSSQAQQISEKRLNLEDFDRIQIIGRGAFGSVHLVRQKKSRKIFAMKTLNKFEMLKRPESAFFWEERNVMAFAESEWIVKLYYAFQDLANLYMIMEYLPGGNLINLLDRYEINEDAARFYCAEITMAVDALHLMGFIHRDVKPDNLLIDQKGHLKLTDFGTCIKMDKNGLARSETAVGTPDYISPEILKCQNTKTIYGREVDWWSVGVILYEMLFGETPFYAETLLGTYGRIMRHRDSLQFPADRFVSNAARNLIVAFLTDRTERIGRESADEIREHPFFAGQNDWNWSTLRNAMPPIVPTISHDEDTTNFEEFPTEDRPTEEIFSINKNFSGNHLCFVGFSFSNEQQLFFNIDGDQQIRDNAIKPTENDQLMNEKISQLEGERIGLLNDFREIRKKYQLEIRERQNLEDQLEDLQHQIDDEHRKFTENELKTRDLTLKIGKFEETINTLKADLKLKIDENLRLTKKNEEFEMNSVNYEKSYHDLGEKHQELFREKTNLEEKLLVREGRLDQEIQENKTLHKRLDEFKDRFENLFEESNRLRELETKQTTEIKKLRQTIETSEEEKTDLKSKVEALRSELEKEKILGSSRSSVPLKNELIRSQSDTTAEKQFEEEKLKTKKCPSKIFFQNFEQNISELQSENEILNKRIQQFEQQNQIDAEKMKNFEEEIQKLKENLNFHRAQISTRDIEIVEREKRFQTLEIEKKQIEEKNVELMENEKKLRETIWPRQEFDFRLKILDNQINVLQNLYENSKQEVRRLTEQNQTLKIEFDQISSKNQQIDEELIATTKKCNVERSAKELLVKKVEEMLQNEKSKDLTDQGTRSRPHRESQRRNLIRRLEQNLETEKTKYKNLQSEKDAEICLLNEQIQRLRKEIERVNEEMKKLLKQTLKNPSSNSPSKTKNEVQNWIQTLVVNGRRTTWKRQFLTMKKNKLQIFNSNKDAQPIQIIEFSSLFHVRSVSQGELFRIDQNLIPRIFQILYDNSSRETFRRNGNSTNFQEGAVAEFNGHSFFAMTYRTGAECEICNRSCHHLFNPPSCLVCARCRLRFHRSHYDHEPQKIPSCRVFNETTAKDLYILCSTEDDQKLWLSHLSSKIQRPVTERTDSQEPIDDVEVWTC